jgi:multiple sugar transport system substrate-binding protein
MPSSRISRREFLKVSAGLTAGAALSGSLGTTARTARAQGQTVVKYWWHHGGDIGKAVEAAIAEFEKQNPDIKVEGLQAADVHQKVNTALAGGVGPDIWDGEKIDFVRGAANPLDDFLKGSNIDINDFPQKDSLTWNGKVYALPAIESGMENALLWNKQLFKEAGLDPEQPPKTLDELMTMAKKLTKLDSAGNIAQLGFDTRDSSAGMFPNWLTSEGIKYYDEATKKITFTQPEAIALVEWIAAFEKEFGPEKIGAFHKSYPTWGSVTPGGAFSSGKEAMMVDGSWAPGGLKLLTPDLQIGYAYVPTKTGALKTQQLGAHTVVMNAQTKVADAAWKLMLFMATKGNEIIYEKSGSFAYSKSFAAKVDTSPYKGLQWYFDSVKESSFVIPRDYCPISGDAWAKWWTAIDDVVYGRASAQDALARAERETQPLLEQALQS